MRVINGYQMTKDFSAENAGFCKWGFAEKDGYEYFIKEFLAPKYPLDSHELSPSAMEKKRKQCDQFYSEKTRVYRTLESCRTGNIVVVEDFFRDGAKYYAVTQKIVPSEIPIEQISRLDQSKKLVLMRSLLYSFAKLHSKSVIHADIKPDNILIKKTEAGYYTGKIIDFDSAFFESAIPDEIQGDQIYLAPEVRLRMMEEPVEVTTKVDIFALGILFHQYWSGKMPTISADYEYIFESVLDDHPVQLDDTIPLRVRKILTRMLDKNPASRPTAAQILKALEPPTGVTENKLNHSPGKGEKGFHRPGDLG